MSIRRIIVAAALLAVATPTANSVAAGDTDTADVPVGDPAHAIYGDKIIDLSQGWQGAGACIELGTETRCYDTQDELEAHHPEYTTPAGKAGSGARAAALLACTALRLYPSTGYGGTPLSLFLPV